MQLSIKNLKILKMASEETLCFEAVVYVDGKKAFQAHNAGHGGCNDYHAFDEAGEKTLKDAHAWAKAQPKVTSDSLVMSGEPFTFQPDLDYFISELIEAVEIEREVKKEFNSLMKKPSIKVGEKIFHYKCPVTHPKWREVARKQYPDCIIINDMPAEEAIKVVKQYMGVQV